MIGNIIIDVDDGPRDDLMTIDPITFAVVKNGSTPSSTRSLTVMRTARLRSPGVMDYSRAVRPRRGWCAGQTIALHSARSEAMAVSPAASATTFIRRRGRSQRSYRGGMHLPDIFAFMPIFHVERCRRFRWSSAITPTSADAWQAERQRLHRIYQEGLNSGPQALRQGVLNTTLAQIIALNVRVPDRVG